MNYLAHLLLTKDDEALTVGNFLADILRKSDIEALPKSIQAPTRSRCFFPLAPMRLMGSPLRSSNESLTCGMLLRLLVVFCFVPPQACASTLPLPADKYAHFAHMTGMGEISSVDGGSIRKLHPLVLAGSFHRTGLLRHPTKGTGSRNLPIFLFPSR